MEIRSKNVLIKFRSHYILSVYKSLLPAEGFKLSNIIYQFLTTDVFDSAITFNPKELRNGLVDKMFDKQRVRFRFVTIPANPVGFDILIHILTFNKDLTPTPLDKLGYSIEEQDNIKSIALNAKN